MNWTKYLPCLLILGMGSGCSSEVKHPGENQDLCLTDSLLKIVSVDTVHLHDVADELTLNGRVTFNQEQVAHVYPMFGGTVTELRAEVGDYVRKGDILAILRSGEVADYERQMKLGIPRDEITLDPTPLEIKNATFWEDRVANSQNK